MATASNKLTSVALPEPLVKDVERLAKRQGRPATQLIRRALEQYVEDTEARRAAWKRARAYGAKKAKEQGIRTEEDVYRIMYELRHGRPAPLHARPARRR